MSAADNAKKILSLCEAHWDANRKNCSGFVKAVASELGVALTGDANGIVRQIQKTPWKILKSGVEAKIQATNGMFVVAGLEATKNGHVVVVVPGTLASGKYPTAYWGSLGGVGKKNATLNWSWSSADRDKVIYACRSIG